MIRKIIVIPNPLLRKKSKPVGNPPAGGDKKIKKIIIDLLETIKNASEPEGMGLSAIQIAQPVRIFVAKTGKNFGVFINPKIISASKETLKDVLKKEQQFFEGCLSIPKIYGFVDRPYEIKLEWLNEKGQKKSQKFKNQSAVCLQHELDHLNGILFIDRILKQKGKIYEFKGNKKDDNLFEEINLL